ncbi:DegT/DnrJ/EryC1/StrS aminotransferase family protein [Candidatus Parcubacteria bacterium]|nr:DegT/DnrJ/EryC1/StrS aminotransferase family protein [Candidatus Parcubacteria bacterium]
MYFVHPQIKLNTKNLKPIFNCFLKTPDLESLEDKLAFYFPNKKIIFTDMGRSAFQIIVEKLNLRNTQMLVPAYICDIFFPIFKKYNIQPIFLDINIKTFNIKIEEIEQKINPAIKSILIPHIYGLSNDMEKISLLAQKYNLKIIEDCAHSFDHKYNNKYLGNFGDAALFSLYKIFPTCRGGMIVLPVQNTVDLPKTRFSSRDFISFLNCFSLFAFLFKSFGSSAVGGSTAQKMIKKEKSFQPSRINKVSLNLFQYFLENEQKNLEKRIKLGLFFQNELKKLGFEIQNSQNNSFCYLSALVPENLNRDVLVKKLRKYKIFCTRIWHTPIILNPEVQKKYNLNLAEFPNTIEIAQRIINFPLQSHYNKKDIENIINKLKLLIN